MLHPLRQMVYNGALWDSLWARETLQRKKGREVADERKVDIEHLVHCTFTNVTLPFICAQMNM